MKNPLIKPSDLEVNLLRDSCLRNHGYASQQESLSWCARHGLATDLGSNETCSHQELPNWRCGDCSGFLFVGGGFQRKANWGLRHSCLETASGGHLSIPEAEQVNSL